MCKKIVLVLISNSFYLFLIEYFIYKNSINEACKYILIIYFVPIDALF